MNVPEEVLDIARGVASEVRRRYPGFVEIDDLLQEAWIWASRNPKRLRDYLDLDGRDRTAAIASSLRHRLRYVAEREKASALGYSLSDVAFYTPAQVREELLPALFDPEAWTSPPKAGQDELRSKRDPAHGGNWLASLADVADAYRRLPAHDRLIVALRWRDEMKQREIAVEMDLAESTVSERLERVVERIVELLGGDRPEHEPDEIVGRRRVQSNAAAQAQTGADYAGQ